MTERIIWELYDKKENGFTMWTTEELAEQAMKNMGGLEGIDFKIKKCVLHHSLPDWAKRNKKRKLVQK